MIKRVIAIILSIVFVLSCTIFASAIDSIEAPEDLTVELKTDSDGNSYFEFNMKIPESVKNLVNEDGANVFIEIEYKIDEGEWSLTGGVHLSLGPVIIMYPTDIGINEDIDIKINTYYFRAKFGYYSIAYYDEYGNAIAADPIFSEYSNTVKIGLTTYKKDNASQWAVPELDKAVEYGFITDAIKDEMNAPITREELCEVIMKLYEKSIGEAEFTDMSAFTDTQNPEVFKAYELGIVNGVGDNKFAPKELTNREQVATMLHRAVKAIRPDADFSTEGAESFKDENLISPWAIESVKFMNKNGLILGSDGYVNPKGTTTREQAVLIVVRIFEKYGK